MGLSAGEAADFQAPLRAGDHTDHDVDVTVTVTVGARARAARRSTTTSPSSRASSTPSTSCKDDLRRRLASRQAAQQGVEAATRCSRRCSAGSTSRCPERLVEAQVDDHFDDGHGDDAHRAEFEKQTREALTAQFVLDAIAAKEELSVGEGELSEYIVRNAPRYGMSPTSSPARSWRPARCPAVIGEVVRAKALALVLEHADGHRRVRRAGRPRGACARRRPRPTELAGRPSSHARPSRRRAGRRAAPRSPLSEHPRVAGWSAGVRALGSVTSSAPATTGARSTTEGGQR